MKVLLETINDVSHDWHPQRYGNARTAAVVCWSCLLGKLQVTVLRHSWDRPSAVALECERKYLARGSPVETVLVACPHVVFIWDKQY
jgi:hypothetical protein